MPDLHEAAQAGDLAAAKALVEADPYQVAKVGEYRRTPLHLASREGHAALVQLLLDHSADANARDYGGGTALHGAAEAGRLQAARALVAHGAKLDLLDEAGETALHRAVRGGHDEVVELLLAGGADPNPVGDHGGAPLHAAAAAGRLGAARLLLAHGALANLQSNASERRLTPLHDAERAGHAELAGLLRRHGGDDPARGPIPIHRAAEMGYADRVELLLGQDPQLISSRDFLHRRTPLHWAAAGGHDAIVRRLIALGADPDARDKRGKTPLDLASAAGLASVAEALQRP
jgi:ankyrin repeat protein